MKNIILSLVLSFFCLSVFAQREVTPVDWKKIKTLVETDADYVKTQVAKLSAQQLDTTQTYDERIQAYYGQSFLSNEKEKSLVDKAVKSFNDKNYQEALAQSESALDINPLNITALRLVAYSISLMLKEGFECKYTLDDGQLFYYRMMRCLNTIAKTGLGTKDSPFYVTSINDEYEFLRYYLEIWEYKSQALVGTSVGACDKFELAESSEYYSDEEIYFECSRVLELETLRFKQK